MKKVTKIIILTVALAFTYTFTACSNGSSSGDGDSEAIATNTNTSSSEDTDQTTPTPAPTPTPTPTPNLSGTDSAYLARYIYTTSAGANMNEEGCCNVGYNSVNDVYAVPGDDFFLTIVSLISEDTSKTPKEATFSITAIAGYYLETNPFCVVALPSTINGNDLEVNPETNYWRYK